MKRTSLICVLLIRLFFFLLIIKPIFASGQFVIDNKNQESASLITKNIFTYIDTTDSETINEIKEKKFEAHHGGVLNLGVVKNTLWIKIELKNNTAWNNFIVKVAQPVIDTLEFYSFNSTTFTKSFTGEYQKFNSRVFNSPNYLFPINIEPGNKKLVFIKIKSNDYIQVPLYIGSMQAIMENDSRQALLFGIYSGVIIIMILYNFFIYFSVRDKSYYYYILYIFFVGLTQAVFKGFAYQYLWPSSPMIAMYSSVIVPTLSGITTGFFMKSFLDLKINAPKLNTGVNLFIIFYTLFGLIGLFISHSTGTILLQSIALIGSIYALLLGYLLTRRRIRIAYFFLLAYSVFLLSIIIFVLCNFNIIPYNNFTAYILEIGSVLQITLLSLALADKINTYRKAQADARREALLVSKENERLVREQNIVLEKEVKSRTADLQKANEDLNETLVQLKTAQSKLVESEKMASLGQLTAGIAHEINNPINFVASNVKPLELDIQDIFAVLEKYENVNPTNNVQQQLQEIEDYKKQIDVGYIGQEIKSLLDGIKEGALRTAEIVKNLKNFIRLDQSNLKLANLNEGIESTLLLVRNTFPTNLVVDKNLGKINLVECAPGKINQVFMNIITNAVQAIKSKNYNNGEIPTLSINSWAEADSVVKISVKDNGVGMPESTIEKIYEPFFTTKAVGEGTGLGMSIVKGIIDSHHGNLEIISSEGVGTEFVLTLPILSPNQ